MTKFFSLQFQLGLIGLVLLAVSPALNSPLAPGITVAASEPGFGVIGDSNSDEYRADDNRGGLYAATTFNWVEQLVAQRRCSLAHGGVGANPVEQDISIIGPDPGQRLNA